MRAAEISTGAISQLSGREQAVGLDDGALAVDPLRLDGIEPGAFDRQVAGQDTHAMALLLDLLVVSVDPSPHMLADVPGGVVPDQRPDGDAPVVQSGARSAPGQELRGDGAERAPGTAGAQHVEDRVEDGP
jgi:hypothetical protein